MRSEVKSNLLQALGAAMMVDPLDDADAQDLAIAQLLIKATVKAWVEYEDGDITSKEPEA
jgi:hypothetical protein